MNLKKGFKKRLKKKGIYETFAALIILAHIILVVNIMLTNKIDREDSGVILFFFEIGVLIASTLLIYKMMKKFIDERIFLKVLSGAIIFIAILSVVFPSTQKVIGNWESFLYRLLDYLILILSI